MNYQYIRYEYASYKSRERAETALEDMYASGEVSSGEHPTIERRKVVSGIRYAIVLNG